MDFHSWLLHRPALGLPHLDPWIYGSGPTIIDLQAQLAALLATKGVPTAYCECSKKCPAAIKKLGAPSIANPWHALKALTSKPGNNFQYVLRSDLMDFMDSKAASKRGAQISMQKKKKKKKKDKKQNKTPSAPPVAPDPSTIQLNPAHFIDDERDQVEQIPLAQVTADSRGLAVASLSEALPYLREPKNISSDFCPGFDDH